MARALWWIKRDFRLRDNPALHAALKVSATVMPVFVFEPQLLGAEETSAFHVAAWCEALGALRDDLAARTGLDSAAPLVLHGDVIDVFERLRAVAPFETLVSHEEVGTEITYARDRAVKRWCLEEGVEWREPRQTGVFRGRLDRDRRSARWKAFMAEPVREIPPADALARLEVPAAARALEIESADDLRPERFGHGLTEEQARDRQPVSEADAEATLESFLGERAFCYSGGISSPHDAFVCGSRLSVHLAWGTITGRRVYVETEARRREVTAERAAELERGGDADRVAEWTQWAKSLRSFKSRLHWRDHFMQRLETEPEMEFRALHPAYDELPTPGDRHLDAWLAGRTGWPMVDACMRCARATGFLNFRMRAFVTSVAVHSLRIDWRKTLYPTARYWADYEPGIHVAQTQMQAGVVGINQLRIYSPTKQLTDHDPDAVFVRRWVPELADATPEAIRLHSAGPDAPAAAPSYPLPLVDWRESSRAMKNDYWAIKRRPETRETAEEVYAKHGSRRPPRARGGSSSRGESR